ncbi:tetratricopeptide repeat protein [Sphaerisporangium sp. NPDC049002]|uniref:tetratricopeptide repeat protein n=1 Tax=unclassified Sphaerisporangium TaxID=2630420 RepID=UPI0033DF85BC
MDGEDVGNGMGPLIAVAGLAVVRALHSHRASLRLRDEHGREPAEWQRRQYGEELNAAILHHADGMPAEALRRYGALLRLSPNDPVALTNAAQIWIDHGVSLQDAARALDLADAVVVDPRRRARVGIQRARLRLYFGRYSEAAAELTASVAVFPDPGVDPAPLAWYLLGTCLAEMGDEPGAQRAFQTVLAHRPLVAEAWISLARVLADSDRAAAFELLEHGSSLIAPPGRASRAEPVQGSLAEVVQAPRPEPRHARPEEPVGAEAREAAGGLLVEAALIALDPPKDHDRARAFLLRAARLCPESPCPPLNLAMIDEELHDLDAFRRHIREAVSKVRPADHQLIARLLSGAFAGAYGNVTLAAMGEARLLDGAEPRRRLAAWERRRTAEERPRPGNRSYNGVAAGHRAIVSGPRRPYSLNGGTAMTRNPEESPGTP